MVQSFIDDTPPPRPDADAQDVRMKRLWNKLDSMEEKVIARLADESKKRKQKDDIHTLTRSLLYDIEVANVGKSDLDALLILPTRRLIVGKKLLILSFIYAMI
jgi:hypothetical protein